MKYYVDFQYMPKGKVRPLDDGSVVPVEVDETQFALIPSVGDFVHIAPIEEGDPSFSGKVKSRLFTYVGQGNCGVNIVVEETDDDWGALIKE